MFIPMKRHLWVMAAACATMLHVDLVEAQLTDQTQTPNAERAGIFKSLEEQIGAGVGNVNTPGSSSFIIARDPARAVRRGRQLFQRKFTLVQGFGPRTQDGIGNIETARAIGAGLIESCAGCHGRPRGAAGFGGDVVTRPDSRDAPHLFGLGLQEMLSYFNATVVGVLFPPIYFIGLMVIAYIDRSPYKAARDRKLAWVFFLCIMIGGLLVTFIGSFFRGPGWNWVWPWDGLFFTL